MMTKMRLKTVVLALGVLALGQAAAQDTLLEYVVDACEQDLDQYCSQVTPGDGRLLYCIAAHADKISGECNFALFEAASLLAQMADAVLYVAESCATEIDTLCADVALGEGRILACLEAHDAELGDSCKTALAETIEE